MLYGGEYTTSDTFGTCCHGYLMQALAGLVILAPQAVGTPQVEEHHGPS